MNEINFRLKQIETKNNLMYKFFTGDLSKKEKMILVLEILENDISPNSRYWRIGFKKYLKKAIKLLKKEDKVMKARTIELISLPKKPYIPSNIFELDRKVLETHAAIIRVQEEIDNKLIRELYTIYKDSQFSSLYVISETEFKKFLLECLPKYLNKEEL